MNYKKNRVIQMIIKKKENERTILKWVKLIHSPSPYYSFKRIQVIKYCICYVLTCSL